MSLHGAGGGFDQGLWLGRLTLGDGYRFISPSRYGYLRTPIPKPASLKTQAALYKGLLDHLQVGKVIVVGGSAGVFGHAICQRLSRETSALLLISAVSEASVPGDKPAFYVGMIHLIQRSDYAYWLVARFMQPAILNLMGIPAEVYAKFPAVQKRMAQEMLDTMHPMTQRYRGTVNDETMLGQEAASTDRVSAPALILHAKDDSLVSYHHAEHAHRKIAGSRLVLFDIGGHGLLSQVDAVRREARGFVAGTGAAK